MARLSDLSIRALRLYDGLGLLRPADVDPATGYRRYAEQQVAQAVLIARLREADVPLPEVAAVLTERDGPARRARLERWWSGREHDVIRQRDLVTALSRQLEQEMLMPPTTTHQISASVLAGALAAVLRCTSDDDSAPVITGVFVEPSVDSLRLVATDKFRLAVWDLPATGPGGLPLLLDGAVLADLLAGLGAEGTVTVEVSENAVVFRYAGVDVAVPTIAGTYPEYRRLLPTWSLPVPRALTATGSPRRSGLSGQRNRRLSVWSPHPTVCACGRAREAPRCPRSTTASPARWP